MPPKVSAGSLYPGVYGCRGEAAECPLPGSMLCAVGASRTRPPATRCVKADVRNGRGGWVSGHRVRLGRSARVPGGTSRTSAKGGCGPPARPSRVEMGLIGIDAMILWRHDDKGGGAALVRCPRPKTGGAHRVAASQKVAIQGLAARDAPPVIRFEDPECKVARLVQGVELAPLFVSQANREKILGNRRTVTTQAADAIINGDMFFAAVAIFGMINRFGGGTRQNNAVLYIGTSA